MAIVIQSAGYLKKQIAADVIIEGNTSVGEAIDELGVARENEMILLVNGKLADWNTKLQDGDTLSILPGLSGG